MPTPANTRPIDPTSLASIILHFAQKIIAAYIPFLDPNLNAGSKGLNLYLNFTFFSNFVAKCLKSGVLLLL